MRIKKIYFNRMYDQWRGEPLYVEDGLDDDKLYIRIMDVESYKRGAVNTITVDYKDLNGATYTILGECDYDKKLAIFDIPLSILSNNGVYEVGFSLSFNTKDKEGVMLKTAIQTFEIIDTIEADDEAIAQDPHYPILVDLINQLADYKVDTSIFPTREEMVNAIDESINLDKIIEQINDKGYITQTQLNDILKNYLTKFESSDFARRSDLNKFVTNIKFIQELDRYVLKSSMNNYVLKEEGKTLTTHDLTDELYEKLVNLDLGEDGVEIDLSEYQKKIDDILNTKDKTITGAINEIKNDIPTKTSQLQNDSGYLTQHQDLSDYAKKTELHSHENKDVLDNITTEKISSWDNKSEFDGDYDSLTNKPTIPTKVSELENDNLFVTEKFVDDKIIEASLGKEVDLSEYAKKTDIPYVPTKVSELENDKGYASEQFVDKNIPIEIENLSGTDNTKTMLDYLKEIVGFFISDTIILGNKIKYKHIIRGKINTNININEKDYSNISYISMINMDYNILTTFILADEGNLRIETPYTPILDDANMYIGLSISQIGEVHELIGSGSVSGGSSHEHDNKDILDTITQEMINTWNNKSDLTINDNINEISKTQTYSNEMIESRLLETNTEITAVQDDLDSMDERVTYLETEQTKMGSFDGSYDSLTNKPTIPTKTSELTNDSEFTTKEYVDDNKFSKNYEDLNNEPFTFIPIKLTETNESNGTITAYCDVFDLEQGYRYVADFTKYNYACLYTFNNDNTKNTLVTTTAYLSTGRNGMITVMSSSETKRDILWMSAYGSEQIRIIKNSDETFTITNSLIVPRVTNTREFTPTSNYHLVHKKYVDDKVAGVNASTITGLSTVATSGDYNDLTNKPTIPSEYTLPTASATQLGGVKIGAGLSINDGVLSANGGGTADSVDWSNVQNKPTIPSKVSQLTNDSGFITSIPSEYITEIELEAKGYLTEHQNISGKVDKVDGKGLSTNDLTNTLKANYDTAYTHSQSTHAPSNAQKNSDITKAEIETKLIGDISTHTHSQYLTSIPNEYITETELNAKGYLTEHQSLDGLATETYVNTKVSELVDSAPETLDTLKELSTALGDDPNFATTVSNQIGNKVDKVDGKSLVLDTEIAKIHSHDNKTILDGITSTNISNWNSAYTHSTSAHAPSNAQKNSDITKTEIEAKLTGDIATHTHSQYLTEHQDLSDYALATDLHEHDNKTILDNITQTTIDMINNAIPYKGVVQASGNLNNCTATGFYKIQQGASNLPINEYSFLLVYNEAGQSTLIQVWFSATSDKQRIRRRANLTWGNWYTVYTENEPPAIPSEYITETELNDKGYATEDFVTETVNNASISGGYTHPETHPASMITGLSTVATSGSYNDLTNKPTIPSIEGLATETYVNNKVSGLVDSAPEALNTLNELATALGNDANFATTISNQIGSKVDKVEGKSLVLNTEIAKIHEHGNKDLLDTIEADNVHAHSNKSVIDTITSDMTTKWNKSIPFENTYVSDCDTWLTNGYTKTSTSTTHHPSVCTGADRWGVLFYISENAQNGTGTQMYFPIDGTYAGRIFTRKIVNRSAGAWNLVSTFNGSYNDLTDKPTIPSEYTLPTASADTLGGIKVGAGLSINDGVLSANGGGTADSVDWSNVQNRPTVLSQFTNDSGFISSIPSEYITETELNAKGYLTEHQDISGKVDKVNGKGLSTNDLTDDLKANYDSAYEHSQSAHAPSNAQKNSDITKAEIEAKLTGNITTHTHSQYLTSHQSLDGYVKTTDLSTVATSGNYNDLSNKPTIPSAYTHPSTHPASMITGLSKVATSGSYNDLSNKPTIPTIPDSLPANGGNADTVNNFRIWSGTQAQYDAITTKDSNTIYMITE